MQTKESYIQIKINIDNENSCEGCEFYSSTHPTFCRLFYIRNIETRLPICKNIENKLMSSLEIQKTTRVLLIKILLNDYLSNSYECCSCNCKVIRHDFDNSYDYVAFIGLRYYCPIFNKKLNFFGDNNNPTIFKRCQECLNAEI